MDRRTLLQNNDHLSFPGLECVIDAPAGRGSSVLAYIGHYRDREDPRILHRVLIRELFPYDATGGITRLENGDLQIERASEDLYSRHRTGFMRSNEVHSRMAEEIPADLDLHINTFSCHNTLYGIMGYTGGRTLEQELKKTDPESQTDRLLRIVCILRGALQVLSAFHKAGYLHLDISPDNILLIGEGERERTALIDFDSVHSIEEIRRDFSLGLSIKEGYTAPEILMGQRTYIGIHSDLYAMTAVFWHCLSGVRLSPIQRVGASPPDPAALPMTQHLSGAVVSMLCQIIKKGLVPSPGRRYQAAGEMMCDLDELEDRIIGRGITPWALWESGRARFYHLLHDNTALQYICDESRLYPIRAETEDGRRAELFSLLNTQPSSSDRLSDNPPASLLLLGGGGLGKTTSLFRLAWSAYSKERLYREGAPAVFYISLYGYRDRDGTFLRDTLLEGLKFKPGTDSMAGARRELMLMLDDPVRNDLSQNTLPQNTKIENTKIQKGQFRDEKLPSLILLLDGFNEAEGDTSPLLQEIRLLAKKRGVRILMTSRSDPGDPLFEKITLCRLDPSDVRKILSKEGILPPENMEVFDLLSFPILLSLYIEAVKSGETSAGRLQGREQLLSAYFASLRKKEISPLSSPNVTPAGVEAVFLYLLPEIAVYIQQRGPAVTDPELMTIVEKCFRELSGKVITTVFPQWIGHIGELRLGTEDADAWYGRAVLDLLHKRAGILVRDEQGRIRILHQIMEEYLAAESARFHLKFDREKKKRKNIREIAAASLAAVLVFLFGIYNYRMRLQIEEKHSQMIRAETEQEILESVERSGSALAEGDRREAVDSAVEAVLLAYADPGQAELVFTEEDGLDLLWNDYTLIRERIGRIDNNTRNAAGGSVLDSSLPPSRPDSHYTSMARKALTDALGVYDFTFEGNPLSGTEEGSGPSGSRQEDTALCSQKAEFFTYESSYPHTEVRISTDRQTIMLYSMSGFRVYSAKNQGLLCDQALPDPENVYRMAFLRSEELSQLEVTWLDGTVRGYDASDGKMLTETKGPAPDPSAPVDFLTDTYRFTVSPDSSLLIFDKKTGEDLGEFDTDAEVSGITQVGGNLLIKYGASGKTPPYALLLNENLDTLAQLQGFCDELDNDLFFDCSGSLYKTPLYSLSDLLDAAVQTRGSE